jgi:hypothetical protein
LRLLIGITGHQRSPTIGRLAQHGGRHAAGYQKACRLETVTGVFQRGTISLVIIAKRFEKYMRDAGGFTPINGRINPGVGGQTMLDILGHEQGAETVDTGKVLRQLPQIGFSVSRSGQKSKQPNFRKTVAQYQWQIHLSEITAAHSPSSSSAFAIICIIGVFTLSKNACRYCLNRACRSFSNSRRKGDQ